MRVSNLFLYDPDIVEAANMSGQLYSNSDIGMSKVMQHVAEKYPATKQLMTIQGTGLSRAAWGLTKIRSYYNREQTFL